MHCTRNRQSMIHSNTTKILFGFPNVHKCMAVVCGFLCSLIVVLTLGHNVMNLGLDHYHLKNLQNLEIVLVNLDMTLLVRSINVFWWETFVDIFVVWVYKIGNIFCIFISWINVREITWYVSNIRTLNAFNGVI